MNSHSSQLTSPTHHHNPQKHSETSQPGPKPSTLAAIRQFARIYDFNPARHPALNSYIPN